MPKETGTSSSDSEGTRKGSRQRTVPWASLNSLQETGPSWASPTRLLDIRRGRKGKAGHPLLFHQSQTLAEDTQKRDRQCHHSCNGGITGSGWRGREQPQRTEELQRL